MDQTTKRVVLDGVFASLNGQQREAASVTSGELMIAAGAGTGKTYTLTAHYIANMLADDEPRADSVLAITYTRAAAGELGARIRDTLEANGADALARKMGGAWISTFHAFCIRVLRAEAVSLVGEDAIDPFFTELDELESASLLSQSVNAIFEEWALSRPDEIGALLRVAKRARIRASIAELLATCKTYGVTIDAAVVDPSLTNPEFPWEVRARGLITTLIAVTADVERHYTESKRARSALDFADLITRVDHLFTSRPDIAARYRERFTRILVDEFQDTNHLQYRIVRAISRDNITRVGDRAQSIYGFQGAQADVFDRAQHDVEEAHARGRGYPPMQLSTNYRSHQGVLGFVNNIFDTDAMFGPDAIVSLSAGRNEADPKFNRHRNPDDTSSAAPRVEVTLVAAGENKADPATAVYARDASAVADRVQELLKVPGTQLTTSDIVIVLRARTHAQAYVDALMALGIPAYTLGGRGLLKDPAVRAALNFFKVVDNPRNEEALVGLLISDYGQVSDQALANVVMAQRTREQRYSLWEALADPSVEMAPADRAAIDGVIATVEMASQAHGILSVESILKAAIAQRGVDLSLIRPMPDGSPNLVGTQSYANLMRFADMAREWEDAGGSLRSFLEYLDQKASEREQLDLADWEGDPNDAGAVRIMTIHSTKGLEYPVVIAAIGNLGIRVTNRGMARLRWNAQGGAAGEIVISMAVILTDQELSWGSEMAVAAFGTKGTNAEAKEVWGVELQPTQRVFKSLEFRSAGDEARLAEVEEVKRLEYVAMTRARDLLLVSYHAKGSVPNGSDALVPAKASGQDLVHAALCDRYIEGEWPEYTVRADAASPIAFRYISAPAGADELDGEEGGGADATSAVGASDDGAATARAASIAAATSATLPTTSSREIEYDRPRAPMDTQLAQISASHIKALSDCPRQFYLKYREGLGTLRYTDASSAANLGNALHGIMQHSWRETVPSPAVVARVAGVYRLPADDAAKVEGIAGKLLGTDLLGEVRTANSGSAEHQFYEHVSGDLDGTPREVFLQGFIDLLSVSDTGVATIVDYKTGQGNASPERYRIQAECYGLVALRDGAQSARVAFMMPEAPEKTGTTVDRGVPIHWFTYTQEERERLERAVLIAHRDMERAGQMDDPQIEEWLAANRQKAKDAGATVTEPCFSCGYDGPLCAVGARRHRGKR